MIFFQKSKRIMRTFNELYKLIDNGLKNELYQNNTEPEGLYKPIKYILRNGGKRIRPALVLMAANLFTNKIDHFIKPALALEVFHNFTLLHDDIMDDSPLRRGKPTVHTEWNNNTAILSGDAMAILAYQCLEHTPTEVYPQVMNVFNHTSLKVCEGQQYDMEFETRQDVRLDEYLTMIRLKTAELLAGSLKIGAVLGGADDKNADLLYDFGINLGIAFQIKDDCLDTFGDFKKFGKRIGNDIIENKKTFLLIKAFELAKGTILEELKELIFVNQSKQEYKVKRVTEIFRELKIDEICDKEMNLYFKNAMHKLESVDIDNEKKIELEILAKKFIHRDK